MTHIRKGYFLIQLPTTVWQLLGNIAERMPATVSRRILVTTVTIPLREGKARRLLRRLRSSKCGQVRELLRVASYVLALLPPTNSWGLIIMVGEHRQIVYSRSIRTIPWVLGSTQRPVLEALCLQPLSGSRGMSPNALSRALWKRRGVACLASDPCGTHGPRGELP